MCPAMGCERLKRSLLVGGAFSHLDGCQLLLEYLDLAEQHPTPLRMVCGHAFKLLGETQLVAWCAFANAGSKYSQPASSGTVKHCPISPQAAKAYS